MEADTNAEVVCQLQTMKNLNYCTHTSHTSQSIHGGSKGEVGIGEGGAYKVTGVGRDISTLVVGVYGKVKAHQLGKGGAVVTQHVHEVGRPIFVWVDAPNLAEFKQVKM